MQADLLTNRLGVFAELARKSGRQFGRTVLMKLCYFLQEAKNVPLGYHFSLYTYGPFDSDVLADLQMAEELKILDAELVQYPGGYGYLIGPGADEAKVRTQAKDFLDAHKDQIDWAIGLFADQKPSTLELSSTIVFISKEKPATSDGTLVALVRSVKPHFSVSEVESQIVLLRNHNLLRHPVGTDPTPR
jgi:uncharacterized protein